MKYTTDALFILTVWVVSNWTTALEAYAIWFGLGFVFGFLRGASKWRIA